MDALLKSGDREASQLGIQSVQDMAGSAEVVAAWPKDFSSSFCLDKGLFRYPEFPSGRHLSCPFWSSPGMYICIRFPLVLLVGQVYCCTVVDLTYLIFCK